MPAKPPAKPKKPPTRGKRKPAPSGSRGLRPQDVAGEPGGALPADAPAELRALADAVQADGGAAIATYREPFEGKWVVFAALPVEKVEPTPYQRDVSEAHVDRLVDAIQRAGVYLDPIIAVREDGKYWTPNGGHRLSALKRMGARSVVALVLPDPKAAFKILALNVEKAHALRERALEVIRMVRELAKLGGRESDYVAELEDPAYITLGICYEERPRFAGSVYHSVLKRIEAFLDQPLEKALAERERRAKKVMELEDEVARAVESLKAKGLQSPYLRSFVVARVNFLRFVKSKEKPDYDATLDRMIASAKKFDAEKIKPTDLARTGGAPDEPAG
jgi:ParB family chromosome partitioning protein